MGSSLDPVLLVRAGALYVPAAIAVPLWIWRKPSRSACAGMLLASLWNFEVLALAGVVAPSLGWWKMHASGAMFAGMPLEFLIGWVVLWGVVPMLVFPNVRLIGIGAVFLFFDLATMPRLEPVLELGPRWLVGEGIALLFALLPSVVLARATRDRSHLAMRAVLQVAVFSGLILGMLPATIFSHTRGDPWRAWARPIWVNGLLLQVLAPIGVLGLSAVYEFAVRGGGTPVPYDPPVRLVTSGPYAYVANPMQLSAMLLLTGWGWFLGSWWVAASGVMAHIYSAGLASWDEKKDVEERFGESWREYRRHVRNWIPRWRPWHPGTETRSRARLYVAESCGPCSEVRQWFEQRRTTGLDVLPAESYPGRPPTRITYVAEGGTLTERGVGALARAVEHVHFGWAMIGFSVRLPGVRHLLQLLADASGAGPRRIEASVRLGDGRA